MIRQCTSRFAPSVVVMGMALGGLAGCASHPQVADGNLRLISSLRTATSARNATWLEQNIEAIEARRAEGTMTDDEYAAFQRIIELAQAGEWETAERQAVEFQKAQRPSAERVGRLPVVDEP